MFGQCPHCWEPHTLLATCDCGAGCCAACWMDMCPTCANRAALIDRLRRIKFIYRLRATQPARDWSESGSVAVDALTITLILAAGAALLWLPVLMGG